jgi:predicted ArsR family transcriptional regulator
VDTPDDLEARIAGIAALDQPLRRDLFALLRRTGEWTSRDAASKALGIPRTVAAFHLEKLAEAGVVDVRFERLTGRTGPGAGRPSKLYRPSAHELSASVPDRRYDLAGSLLAAAVEEATTTGASVAECLRLAARAAGVAIGADARATAGRLTRQADRLAAACDVLRSHGYEPFLGPRKEIVLANCPFHRLAEEHRSLVCGMNLDFLDGLLEGLGPDAGLTARLQPEPGRCCVRMAPA